MKCINKDLVGLLCCINGIGYSSCELPSLENQSENIFEIHTRMVEVLRRIVEILDINEDGHALFGISYDHSSMIIQKTKYKRQSNRFLPIFNWLVTFTVYFTYSQLSQCLLMNLCSISFMSRKSISWKQDFILYHKPVSCHFCQNRGGHYLWND